MTLANLRDNEEIATKQSTINAADLNAKLTVARLELTLAQEYLALVQSKFDQGQATLKDAPSKPVWMKGRNR